MSDPAAVLVNNPDLSASIQVTNQIADKIIADTSTAVTGAVAEPGRGAAHRRDPRLRDRRRRDAAGAAARHPGGAVAGAAAAPAARQRAAGGARRPGPRDRTGARGRRSPDPSSRSPCTPPKRSVRSRTPSTSCTSRPSCWPVSSPDCSCRSSDMFETLSRRSRSLVDQQLSLIDRLERNEEDPERLESLFRLDHLAARMRRNGANLLVLAGAKVPREQAEPVPVSAIINAAASEVEDYTRVVTATVPDSEVVGTVAGDLVHLLAELLDNALRYSPPISQVRVSAVHTGNGGLVIEVSDIGIGMTESDLRVANTRLQSGGEVNPYTARHMGLFVVGRLAAQHGLVVRLRSTIAGEPNSGTTAGCVRAVRVARHRPGRPTSSAAPSTASPADAHAGIHTALALDEDHDYSRPRR